MHVCLGPFIFLNAMQAEMQRPSAAEKQARVRAAERERQRLKILKAEHVRSLHQSRSWTIYCVYLALHSFELRSMT